jgi:glyoxylase-like metal-dependent hydrolase (beta-lactamase superfamily II)
MKLGELEFHILTDGTFRLDGGAMFGVIPRPMWERVAPPDERNRIVLSMNSLLIHTAGKCILVETGAGDKWDDKRRDIYAFEGAPRLPEQLGAHGVRPEQVDLVVNTHLHFDHCGWNTRRVDGGAGGRAVPTFPNARYVVQRGELEHARNPSERDRASYLPENFVPMEESGQWWLLEGDEEIAPGVELIRAPGHNADMMCVRLSGGGKTAMLLADLAPTTAHLPPVWIMGFDLYPMQTLENKKKWIAEIVRGGWLAIFGHERKVRAAYLREKDGKVVAEPVAVD